MTQATFKYTIAVEKAESRDDGLYIIGIASGPGLDAQGHEMDTAAIAGMAAQIEQLSSDGTPLPYLDWHKKEGLLTRLGDVVKAWVTPESMLAVEVKLDTENPAATYLHKQIQKGKQFGMSVMGTVTEWKDEISKAGQPTKRFFNVVLSEISNTTKPIWTPSFGTVLAKALDEAEAESGQMETRMSDAPKGTVPPEVSDDQFVAAISEQFDVLKAGRAISATNAARLLNMWESLEDFLVQNGVLPSEEEAEDAVPGTEQLDAQKAESTETPAAAETGQVSSDTKKDDAHTEESDSKKPEDKPEVKTPEVPADPRVAALESRFAALEALLAEKDRRIDELESAPASDKPGVVVGEQDDRVVELPDDPSQRLRFGLKLATEGK